MSDTPHEPFFFPDNESAVPQAYEADGDQLKSRLTPLTMPQLGTEKFERFDKVLKHMAKYETLGELPYHIKAVVVDELDISKQDRSDWREVSSRLEISTRVIEKMEKEKLESPTNEMLQQASNKTTKLLLQILNQMERDDIINKIYSKLPKDKRESFKSKKYPSQETTPASGDSGTPSFTDHLSPYYLNRASFEYSPGNSPNKGSYKDLSSMKPTTTDSEKNKIESEKKLCSTEERTSNSTPEQNTDSNSLQLINAEQLSLVDFHSDISKAVWYNIAPEGMKKTKTWKSFESYLENHFPEERRQSQILRLICYTLKIGDFENRENTYIKDQDFANMVAWFGPFKKGEDGCLQKLDKLIKQSVEYSPKGESKSFFAGFMSREEAEECIGNGEEGTFLIRFSSSNARFGSFVITLKTKYGVEHHEVKQSKTVPDGSVTFGGVSSNDIASLYKNRLSKGGVSSDDRTSCTICCPNSPLNSMLKSYKSGPVKSSRGRGRGLKRS